jgi:hypothetical protein
LLVATGAYGPDDQVISPVRGGDERGPATAIAPDHTPSDDDGRGTGCGNEESRESGAMGAKSNIRALVGPISRRCLTEEVTAVGDL